ncbi:MAG: hypothetical protein JAY91_16875, partial [Candidatus Thiodiazotropha endolucinida]|nr:hypothetical protein [Candidatus Thiodiazotropha taylori]MCW4242565.1 hypothetical protein [Candidatus Thiodiazotropha taylori]
PKNRQYYTNPDRFQAIPQAIFLIKKGKSENKLAYSDPGFAESVRWILLANLCKQKHTPKQAI